MLMCSLEVSTFLHRVPVIDAMFHFDLLQGEFKVTEKEFTMADVIEAAEENRVFDI